MKNQDKHYLKALLLASLSTIGMPVAQATGTSGTITRKEREGNDANAEMLSEVMSNGVLESHPSLGEVLGHTAHGSHGSHGAHGSHESHTSSAHTSHVSSGIGGGSGSSSHTGISNEAKGLLIGAGAALTGIGVSLLVKHIIKTHKKHVASRQAEINSYHAYASRDLSSGKYGNDVDRMTDFLIDNDVLEQVDRSYSHKWSHYKYDRKVKRSVKRMQARMGRKKTGKASTDFLIDLHQWKDTRQRLVNAATRDSLDITKDRNALLAVAILLVEKGYLKSYIADDIMSEYEKSRIVRAYYAFLRENGLPETTLVDERRLRLLISLPNNQK